MLFAKITSHVGTVTINAHQEPIVDPYWVEEGDVIHLGYDAELHLHMVLDNECRGIDIHNPNNSMWLLEQTDWKLGTSEPCDLSWKEQIYIAVGIKPNPKNVPEFILATFDETVRLIDLYARLHQDTPLPPATKIETQLEIAQKAQHLAQIFAPDSLQELAQTMIANAEALAKQINQPELIQRIQEQQLVQPVIDIKPMQ